MYLVNANRILGFVGYLVSLTITRFPNFKDSKELLLLLYKIYSVESIITF
jgi:hypothetical protein